MPALVLAPAELSAESSAGPVDDVSLPVELPPVVADTLVIAGPVENPGGAASPQAAARAGGKDGRAGQMQDLPHMPGQGRESPS